MFKSTIYIDIMVWQSAMTMLTDAKPIHDNCRYNKAKQRGEQCNHKNPIAEAIMNCVKPMYEDLSKVILLERCLHGKTQNPNERLIGVIWQRLPKTVFVGFQT